MNAPVIMTEHIRELSDRGRSRNSPPRSLPACSTISAAQKASLRLVEDKLDAALDRRYGARAKQRRAEAGKDTGTVRFVDNDFTVIADLPKRVKWDQAKLRHAVEIIRTGWGDDPADYVKTKLDVSEAAFAQLAAPGARTLHPGAHGRDRSTDLSHRAHRFGPASVA